jgi:hypothetical protein
MLAFARQEGIIEIEGDAEFPAERTDKHANATGFGSGSERCLQVKAEEDMDEIVEGLCIR